MSKKYFAGIGSRTTPLDVRDFIVSRLCPLLVEKGYILRSGGAEGADLAFEHGYKAASGEAEIYIPWKGFNDSRSERYFVSDEARKYAEKFHPAWNNLSPGAKNLHARNVSQVVGEDLNTPVDFVICWTPDGAETADQITRNTGGTGQALRIASHLGIRIYNLQKYEEGLLGYDEFIEIIKSK